MRSLRHFLLLLFLVVVLVQACSTDEAPSAPPPRRENIVDGLDSLTGLIAQGDYRLVKGNCLACHSAKLITQNRATREGWLDMIHWMQETQGLPDLGKNEGPIVDYLATYYAPEETGRRPPLDSVEWYILSAAGGQSSAER
ncbi:hypothetical protein GGR28_001165 [Lewinella aquimaris]|uniref:Cytochrome c domain-containing protein n=1 Tax=Neolewinella aquimaris TaxID=1835722 RepID=A0A840E482_9BACT|nr:monoheme cytochrome C [Neolewinella aquimaris]MBB4078552.1 hypothetical protein [Neolewinella aquimaris]